MSLVQLDIFLSQQGKNTGIQRAVEHADRMEPDWSVKAYELLKKFLSTHVGPFMAEEVRSYAEMIDFPLPPHARAWGGIIKKAVSDGLIVRVGYGKVRNVKAHQANAAIWKQVKRVA